MIEFGANLIMNSLSSVIHFTILHEEFDICMKFLSGLSIRTIISWAWKCGRNNNHHKKVILYLDIFLFN